MDQHDRLWRLIAAIRDLEPDDLAALEAAIDALPQVGRVKLSDVAKLRGEPYKLTPREAEVAALVYRCGTNRSIGTKLGLSYRTVEIHRRHAIKKIGAKNAADFVRLMSRRLR